MTSLETMQLTAEGRDPAALLSLRILAKRRDFLAAARGNKTVTPGFILQCRNRRDTNPVVGVGFTCSKKVGNAVARNRAKRRLREIARLVLTTNALPGHDYVLIGRAHVTAHRPFDLLLEDLRGALGR